MRETDITLHGETLWISPYVFSSFVALREKGLPFGVVEVALAEGAHLAPAYRDTSLTARVPSLAHAGPDMPVGILRTSPARTRLRARLDHHCRHFVPIHHAGRIGVAPTALAVPRPLGDAAPPSRGSRLL